jgi:hypothetical protein
MFNPWPAARRVLALLRPPPNWFLGRPQRATIAAVNPAGYILLIDYTNGRDWVDLPGREQDWTTLSTRTADERPSDDELTAVDVELARRRLLRTQPWGIDTEGRLCASVISARSPINNYD